MQPRLRLFNGEEDFPVVAPRMVNMTFGELMAIIEEAGRMRRVWLRDFLDDELQVPEDLFEVLTEYTRMRPGA